MTFKAGDKVYCYNYGIVELTTSVIPAYPLKVRVNGEVTFTQCGRRYSDDIYPTLITLEEAEKRGFVKRVRCAPPSERWVETMPEFMKAVKGAN
jgi:hypothetical protein